MALGDYIAYFILVTTVVYSPGPMTLFLMAKGMGSQFRQVWPVLIGASNAYLLSIVVFALGLATLLQQNKVILKSFQIAGIIYLIYLAFMQFNKKPLTKDNEIKISNPKTSGLYAKGALIALSNPKAILLFSIVFPEFTAEGSSYSLQIIFLGVTFLILQFSSGLFYAYFGSRVKDALVKPSNQTRMNRVSAAVLLMVAGLLIYKL